MELQNFEGKLFLGTSCLSELIDIGEFKLMMVEVSLTEEEAVTLRNLLDLAVKSGGLHVASSALLIDQKIRAAGEIYLKAKMPERG